MRRERIRNRVRVAALSAACVLAVSGSAWADFNFISDTWLPPGGGTNPDWLNPTLWSTGTVPNDDSVNKYLVTIPGSVTVNLDNDPPFTASSSTVYDLNIGNNATLNVGIPMTVEDTITGTGGNLSVMGVGTTFSAVAPAVNNDNSNIPNISVTLGGSAALAYTAMDLANVGSTDSADGVGSVLDLHTVQTLIHGNSNNTVSATNGATVNLSGLTNIMRDNGGGGSLVFTVSGGGTINLSGLQSINVDNEGTSSVVNFTGVGTASFALPALTTANVTEFGLNAGMTINAPKLTSVTNSSIALAEGGAFTTGGLSDIDGSSLSVSGGAVLNNITATAYNLANVGSTDSADGVGSVLDLHTVQTLIHGNSNNTVSATNGATVNLSGLTNIMRDNGGEGSLVFTVSGGGTINLSGLQSINVDNEGTSSVVNFTGVGTASFALPALTTANVTEFGLNAGMTINAPKLTSVTNSSIALAEGGAFTTGGLSDIDGSSLSVSGGAVLNNITATAYNLANVGSTDSADGVGSVLDLHTVQTLIHGNSNNTVSATNGATVNLSGLTNIMRDNGGGGSLVFTVSGGGTINLSGLQSINVDNEGTSSVVNFTGVGTASFALPALTTANVTEFGLNAGMTINAPKLTSVTNSSIALAEGGAFTTGGLSDIDGSSLSVSGGAVLNNITATAYNLANVGSTDSADGVGSVLDLHTVQTLIHGNSNNTVSATNGATVNLSGLTNIMRDNGGGGSLVFTVSGGGTINLSGLQSINVDNEGTSSVVNFTGVGTASFALPALTTANVTEFGLNAGMTINAPKLTSVTNSSIALAEGGAFTTGGLSDIDGSSLSVSGGAVLNNITATAYNLANVGSTDSADGVGSVLDLHTVQTLIHGNSNNTVSATNGATVNLSGLTNIMRDNGGGGSLVFTVSGGGTINLSGLQSINVDNEGTSSAVNFNLATNGAINIGGSVQSQFTQFNVTDSTGKLNFGSNVNLGSTSSLSVAAGAVVQVKGSFSTAITSTSAFQASGAILNMNGNGLQTLELAGLDEGAVNPGNNGNFGFGQLQVGQPTIPTEVDLVDDVDNGNRGAGNANEALYLFGANGQGGLVLNGGSILLIGNLNAYSFQDGSWTNLQNLFTGSQTIVSYTLNGSDGFIARNLTALQAVWQNPGNGAWNTGANWNINTAPGVFNDVFITPVTGVTVSGPTASTTIRSLTIDATPAGTLSVLNLSSASTITIEDNIDIGAQGQINEQGGMVTAQQMTVGGSFAQSGGTTFQLSGGITSNGAVTSAGSFGVGGVYINNGSYIQSAGSANIGSVSGIGITNIGPNVTLNVGSFTQLGGLVNSGTVNIDGSGTVKSITGDGALSISGGTLQIAVNAGLNTVSSLTISPDGGLDIGNSHLIINYGNEADPISTIRAYLIAGRNGGTWNGVGGINSSTAGLPVNSRYGVGYADGADDVVAGLTSGQIEVKYTLLGDANLDGIVSGDDFAILASNLGKSAAAWDKGDFTYSGVVSGDDFAALVSNLGQQANGSAVVLPAADLAAIDAFAAANGLMADVPEPASGAMVVAGMAMLIRRRRAS